ncbi:MULTISPECIES: response regulator transcription factor [Nocardioides]|uniref:DNA-binding response regulator, OmpR family, contains REC and winged-helix (WHTH) domain n=1 Tax=Nocardioides lianchengensis TaxID=1045774 RepID=A0A1G6MSI1_9ACTN|nr:response regulator transcription factor [Nocardioides lianchengensis]NYG10526.1 DNA-binding response OmpR family regulator [Nocardioides lianchengensis]SDC58472.1 DNA-binding response regulator, OmpR family, contains REC and winged-helix (wHTH) domain [Nocardioides lianchengensis]
MPSPVLTALATRPRRPLASRPTALVIEDAEEFARLSRRILEQGGYEVHQAASGERGLDAARVHDYDLVLIDVALPGMDGFEVCRRLRTFTDAHVVMVTAHGSEVEKVIGFRLGADDYVTKPYSPVLLAARIEAVRRRPRAPRAPEVRRVGTLELDVAGREVTVAGIPLALTRIEFDLLSALTASPRKVFSRSELHEDVWGRTYEGDLRVVDVHIGNLRRKLRAAPGSPDPITTVRGLGYRLQSGA